MRSGAVCLPSKRFVGRGCQTRPALACHKYAGSLRINTTIFRSRAASPLAALLPYYTLKIILITFIHRSSAVSANALIFSTSKVSSGIDQQKNASHFRVRHSLVHHQWARQEFSPVRLSACKASILLRKTARAVVRRAQRTLFAPRFRSRSIVAPAHKPAAIFSDQSPRDEHERLREV